MVEPVLTIGLGKAEEIRNVVVQWPSGKRQMLPNLIANQQYVVIEGDANPFPLAIASSR
jgi:hypothetical protein